MSRDRGCLRSVDQRVVVNIQTEGHVRAAGRNGRPFRNGDLGRVVGTERDGDIGIHSRTDGHPTGCDALAFRAACGQGDAEHGDLVVVNAYRGAPADIIRGRGGDGDVLGAVKGAVVHEHVKSRVGLPRPNHHHVGERACLAIVAGREEHGHVVVRRDGDMHAPRHGAISLVGVSRQREGQPMQNSEHIRDGRRGIPIRIAALARDDADRSRSRETEVGLPGEQCGSAPNGELDIEPARGRGAERDDVRERLVRNRGKVNGLIAQGLPTGIAVAVVARPSPGNARGRLYPVVVGYARRGRGVVVGRVGLPDAQGCLRASG